MARVFVGVGSNIEPEKYVLRSLKLLNRRTPIIAVSTFYCTEPEGSPGQPPFYNGVVEISTCIGPVELKRSVLRSIEDELGRVRVDDKYAPRTIDLDVIVYGDEAIDSDEITIPDPEIARRPFLAVPLYELAPEMILPGSGLPLEKIASAFEGHEMKALPEYTETLRKELLHGLREG